MYCHVAIFLTWTTGVRSFILGTRSLAARFLYIPVDISSFLLRLSFVTVGRPPVLPLDCVAASLLCLAIWVASSTSTWNVLSISACSCYSSSQTHLTQDVAVFDNGGLHRPGRWDQGRYHIHFSHKERLLSWCHYHDVLLGHFHDNCSYHTFHRSRSGMSISQVIFDVGRVAESSSQNGMVFEPHTIENASVGDIIRKRVAFSPDFIFENREADMIYHRVEILPHWSLGREV